HHEIEPAVAIQIARRRRVVAARLDRSPRREWDPLAVEIDLRTRAVIADPQESRLEEVAPQNVRVPIAVDIEHRHRIGAVPGRLPLADDLNVLESLCEKLESRAAKGIEVLKLVARNRSVDTPK